MRQPLDSIENLPVMGLLPHHAIFVRRLVDDGASVESACKTAGVEERQGYRLLETENIQRAIQDRVYFLLKFKDAPAARKALRDIMDDATASKSIRVECAKTLLNRAGVVEQKAVAVTLNGVSKAPCEMTGDELRMEINRLQSEIGQRASGAKVIDATPINYTPDQVIDIID
jgi:hypothetical protein